MVYSIVCIVTLIFGLSLQEVCDFVVDRLASFGMLEKITDRLKLHATVMNSKYRESSVAKTTGHGDAAGRDRRRGPHQQQSQRREPREAFDASGILQVK